MHVLGENPAVKRASVVIVDSVFGEYTHPAFHKESDESCTTQIDEVLDQYSQHGLKTSSTN